ncbi:DUF4198 domain-containing protein [Ramlibacter sp.]|uniref:DUF4198 domain-containing protein n=1 Tax=Ramlibacter sp. TaxID=1917967 RepID=UPI0017FD5AB2|nr:DUF4198 domain-containing protein [Ramlibacter sp.]MBA2674749.1 DUF4198 domain-containing protein [Ramlibacter sp.]
MTPFFRLLAGVAAALACTLAGAHEFWMLPGAFASAPGQPVALALFVGQQFAGDRVAFNRAVVASLRDVTRSGAADLTQQMPEQPAGQFAFQPAAAGTHVMAMDSHPSRIELSADKFHAYLHDEGLDDIVQAREAAGTAALAGRERFRRNVKAVVQVGAALDDGYAARTGQKLEIVPLRHPGRMRAGEDLSLQVFFDGRPLGGRLVKLWHRRGAQTLTIRAVTGADGKAAFTLPWAGVWMASVVQMVPSDDVAAADWDSYWGNLSFEVPREIPR